LGERQRARMDMVKVIPMANLLEQAINCNDGDRAAKMIRDALGIESDDVANYCFPKEWPANHEQRANIIAEWLQTEARFLGGRR
jgi:uncharacterized protein HemY